MSGGCRKRHSRHESARPHGFLPEVSSHELRAEQTDIKRENSPARIFLEVFLILGVAGLIALAAVIWVYPVP